MALLFSGYCVVDNGGGDDDGVRPALDLDHVKRLAKQENCKLISFSQKSRVISFRKELGGDDGNNGVRINVYWNTGTVGTCLDHPRQGKTQLFRRNVDMATLRMIFKNPRVHTGAGYHRREQQQQQQASDITLPNFSMKLRIGDRVHVRGYADATIASLVQEYGTYSGKILIRYDDGQTYHVNPDQLVEPILVRDDDKCQDLENEVKMQIKNLDEELQNIQVEKAKLQQILLGFEQEREMERKRKEAEETAKQEAAKRKAEADARAARAKQKKTKQAKLELKRLERGKYCMMNLNEASTVKSLFDQKVVCMACGGRATILIYEDGGWAFTPGLPKLLHNKLNGRQRSLPSPKYVSMGSQDRYYIEFVDGKSEWVGCDDMSTELNSSSSTVKTVAFGEDWDSYFIVYTDGGYSYQNIPYDLYDILNRKKKKPYLDCVSLGPDGEYFLSASNGRAWWGGMSDENLARIRVHKNDIMFMDFGDYGTFFARHN
ncbi:hypothetical protein ACHAXR_011051 [Thalassiosira sp. AJA248-18]